MITMDLTPTQREAAQRRQAFRASIAARAVPDRGRIARPSFGIKGYDVVVPARVTPPVVAPAPVKPEPQPPALFEPSVVWPAYVSGDERVERYGKPRPSVSEIQEAVCAYFGDVVPRDLRSQDRTRAVARPRMIAIYLARKLTDHSTPKIGQLFGGRDHSTIVHAINRISGRILEDKDFAQDIATLFEIITGEPQ